MFSVCKAKKTVHIPQYMHAKCKVNTEKAKKILRPQEKKGEKNLIHSFTHKESLLACMPAPSVNPLFPSPPPDSCAFSRGEEGETDKAGPEEQERFVYTCRAALAWAAQSGGFQPAAAGALTLAKTALFFTQQDKQVSDKSVSGGPMIYGRKSLGKYFCSISLWPARTYMFNYWWY